MELSLYREWNNNLQLIGFIDEHGLFRYDSNYLSHPDSNPLSNSLPLQETPFSESQSKPYFAGLLPEGHALRALSAELSIAEDDYLGLLGKCGLDCIGDIIINKDAYNQEAHYEPVDLTSIEAHSTTIEWLADAAEVSRLSLAGTQSKIGLFHDEHHPLSEGWYRPCGGAPSNYILKFANETLPNLMVVEQLTMTAAKACGLAVAESSLINPAKPAIAIRRFDRQENSEHIIDGLVAPLRRHQEDLAQALGISSNSKYAELERGTVVTIGKLLDSHSAAPALDKRAFLELLLFNYAIGNCDNHLKNHSLLYSHNWKTMRLAPAYDLASTTHYARFSQNMGMAIGSTKILPDISSNDLLEATTQLNLSPKMTQSIAAKIVAMLPKVLQQSGKVLDEQGFTEAPYLADEIESDIAPRLEVLRELAV